MIQSHSQSFTFAPTQACEASNPHLVSAESRRPGSHASQVLLSGSQASQVLLSGSIQGFLDVARLCVLLHTTARFRSDPLRPPPLLRLLLLILVVGLFRIRAL